MNNHGIEILFEEEQTSLDPDNCGNEIYYEVRPEEFVTPWISSLLRNEKPSAYNPQTVSLGPLHHGQPRLCNYEEMKKWLPSHRFPYRIRHFEKLVDRMIHEFISRIQQWYPANSYDLNDKTLGRVMAQDGLFLLQLLREISPRTDIERSLRFAEIRPFAGLEDVLKLENSATRLFRPLLQPFAVQEDIMKLENQIPIFVLERIVRWETDTYQEMMQMMIREKEDRVKKRIIQDMILQARIGTHQDLNSILRQAWHCLCPFPEMHDRDNSLVFDGDDSHILGFVYENIIRSSHFTHRTQGDGMRKNKRDIPTAVELKKKGVKFSPHKGLLNEIRFEGRTCTFRLPTIEMDERTDALMRNLLAFEQLVHKDERKPLRCFVDLMDHLINKGDDVEVLRNSGIIHSRLGSDEDVAKVWNGMCKGLLGPQGDYKPIDVAIDKVIKFYRNKYRIWYVEFKQKYFSRPWLVVSLMAGCIITVFTVLQTIISWKQLRQHS